MALSLVYCMLRPKHTDQPILDLCRAQESFIRRYNSNSARDPPTKLLAFHVSYLRFRPLKQGPMSLSIYLSIYLAVYLSVCFSVYMCAWLSVSLSGPNHSILVSVFRTNVFSFAPSLLLSLFVTLLLSPTFSLTPTISLYHLFGSCFPEL